MLYSKYLSARDVHTAINNSNNGPQMIRVILVSIGIVVMLRISY